MEILVNVVGVYQENCYIARIKDSENCFLVDPGDDAQKIMKSIDSRSLKPEFILLTHGHMDHVGAVDKICERYNIPVYISQKDYDMCKRDNTIFGNINTNALIVKDNDEIKFHNINIKAISTPGHTQGGMCYKMGNIIFSGDTLFNSSIGRTDFIGGDFNEIIDSIKSKIMCFDDNTIILPGHGDKTTIGYERNNNPYI